MDEKRAASMDEYLSVAGIPSRRRIRTVSMHPRRIRAERLILVGFAALAAAVVTIEQSSPIHLEDSGARAAIETVIAICALVTARLLGVQFRRSRRWSDLLLLGALATVSLTDILFSAIPAITGDAVSFSTTGIRLACQVLVAIAFLVAALGSDYATAATRRAIATVGAFFLASLGLAIAISLLSSGPPVLPVPWSTVTSTPYQPLSLGITIGSSLALLVAGLAFVPRIGRSGSRASLLAAAAFMLAAARLQYLAIPVVAPGWVTPRDFARLAAYGLLLVVALGQTKQEQRAGSLAALDAERQRIARDLHDGLAQDLAVIVSHAGRLETELGSQHPLTIAARRALAVSRGAIVDLAASNASSTDAALRAVARELEARFGVPITVSTAHGAPARLEQLDVKQRDHLVRIAREGIVNAVTHGGASKVEVVVDRHRSRLRLRIADNGGGIAEPASTLRAGFGLRTMKARCEELDGRLVTRRRPTGGTEVEVLLPSHPAG
jgi:signal transduction histidine kinase